MKTEKCGEYAIKSGVVPANYIFYSWKGAYFNIPGLSVTAACIRTFDVGGRYEVGILVRVQCRGRVIVVVVVVHFLLAHGYDGGPAADAPADDAARPGTAHVQAALVPVAARPHAQRAHDGRRDHGGHDGDGQQPGNDGCQLKTVVGAGADYRRACQT